VSGLSTITVQFPADLDEIRIGQIAELWAAALDPLIVHATTILRTCAPFDGPWDVQILAEGAFEHNEILRRLALFCALQGGIEVGPLRIETVPDRNWLEACYAQFKAFTLGPFRIHGSHEHPAVQDGIIDLCIDAATAFGSGTHGTTSGCLLLLAGLKDSGYAPRRVLDMGCGSGILAVAAAKLWGMEADAVDIDPESVRVTQRHAEMNGIGGHIHAWAGDGFAAVDRDYDVIIANILPNPLKAMAPELARRTQAGGYCILSGLLHGQANDVVRVYSDLGFTLKNRLDRDEWTALLMQK
jgi:ribosomal protein L11 methyltransferase